MISIVVPAYNEERNLDVLYARLLGQLDKLPHSLGLVIVDDGSPDGTWNTIMRLSERDSRVRGVRLSRNFGHQNALLAGLAAARGKAGDLDGRRPATSARGRATIPGLRSRPHPIAPLYAYL